MASRRVTFLPAFFTTLAIVFVIALVVRIRSYRGEDVAASSATAQTSPSTGPVAASRSQVSIVTVQDAATAVSTETMMPVRRRREPIPFVPPPHPAAATPAPTRQNPPEPKTSLLSRLVSPIVQAISGKPSPAQPVSQLSSGGGHATGTSGGPNQTSSADPNDPNSDTQPPQLLAIFFTPSTIHDGEETVLTVQATDNLTGVRSVSGTIVSPSGAVQGFACQRQPETDTYLAHVAVPKEGAEGVWRVNYISLIDNASNAATLSSGQNSIPATATFRVTSSSSDTQGPTLKAVWLDKPGLKAGDKATVFVQAEDDKSGVNLVSGVFISPAKKARIGFVCRPGDGNTWQGDLSTPACIDCGDWTLEQIQLQDKANNMTTIRSDNPLIANVRVNIAGASCDANGPEVASVTFDRNVVSNAQESIVTVTIIASDDSCGIMSVSGQVTGPATGGGAPRLYFSAQAGGDGSSWIGRITVPQHAAKGLWRVTWLQALDQAHNLTTLTQSDRPLAAAAFRVGSGL